MKKTDKLNFVGIFKKYDPNGNIVKYYDGDVVSFNNSQYVATQNIEGTSPSVKNSGWQKMSAINVVTTFNGMSGDISLLAGNQISLGQTGGTFTINVVEGKNSGLDADMVHGFPGTCITSNLPTGIVYGGVMGATMGGITFSVSAGLGHIHTPGASITADVNPSYSVVTWPTQSQAITNINDLVTYVYVNSSGTVLQKSTNFTTDDEIDSIILGRVGHPGGLTAGIQALSSTPITTYSTDLQYRQFIRAFGPIKLSGNVISAYGSTLKLNRSAGTAFVLGRNYTTDPENPSTITLPAFTGANLLYDLFYRKSIITDPGEYVVTVGATQLDPNFWDDGTGVLNSVLSNKWTVQRLFVIVGVPFVVISYYGRAEYGTSDEAIANIPHEEFSEDLVTSENAIFVGYLIVKEGATNLSSSAQAVFVQSGLMRNTIGGGGSSALTSLDDLSDVTITSPTSNQHLAYNGSGWINETIKGISAGANITVNLTGNTYTISSSASGNGATGAAGPTGPGGVLGFYGSFSDTTDQPLTTANTAYTMTFNTTEEANGVSVGSPTSRIVVSSAGTYNYQFSSQFTNSGIERIISIWMRLNGADLTRSTGHVTIPNNAEAIAAWNYVLTVGAGDYIEMIMSANGTGVVMEAIAAESTPTRPVVPSVILTATQVMFTQLGPTGPTGPTPTDYVSSLGAYGEPGYTGDISIHQGSGISVINSGDNRIGITNIGVRSFNGLTGAVLFSDYVSLFNGRTGSVQGVSAAVAGTGISVSGATGAVTFTNAGVISINGSTGAITNVAKTNTTNTFTELQIFSHSEGLSASFVKTDNINTPLGILNIFDTRIQVGAFSSGVRFNGEDESNNKIKTVLQPLDITADRTIYLPNASGTVALTSQLMGTVNGSTANTTAVTSFNGRTGAIQGVTAAIAGTGISVSGSTGTVIFTNTGVVSINGSTGSLGSLSSPVGYTSSIPVYTYPDGVTTYNAGKTPYYQPHWIILQDTTGYAVRANRTYFTLFNSHTSTNIKTIRFAAHSTVTTGNVYFSVWDANSVTGFPNTNLYTSESIAVASGFGKTSVTNSSGLVTVSAGNFYIAVTFSSTPIIYAYSKFHRIPIYGATDMISGYRIDYLVADTSTFTTPSSIYAAGVTFAGVDYHPTTYTGPRIEYAPVI